MSSRFASASARSRIRIIVILAVAAAAVVTVRLKDRSDVSAPARAEAADSAFPGSGETPVLLDLGADRCVPCKMMMPILDEMRETYAGAMEVIFIDVWKDRAAGERYGIDSIPTQIFYSADGRELYRHQGFYPREEILAKWSELGYEFGS